MNLLLLLVICLSSIPSSAFSDYLRKNHEGIEEEKPNSRNVINLEGDSSSSSSVVWVVQLSDLHFNVHHPERASEFKRMVGPALAMIKPSLVFITGDLTDGKSKDLLTMKQDVEEWKEYEKVIEDVVERSGLDKKIFYDLRGNHDKFGVPTVGGPFDFFSVYSVNGQQRRKGNVHSITLEKGGRKHLFVGFDSAMAIGLRGPTNLFGHPTDQLLADIGIELSQWDSQSSNPVTKIAFGHFPLSFTAPTESGNTLKDVFLNHSLSAYLCGHLHSRFGKNLKRHHESSHQRFSLENYFQSNIRQTSPRSYVDKENCRRDPSIEEFWEWEMGDWRKSRIMRVLAIDAGYTSFVDIDFKLEDKQKIIILPTFPLDSRFMLTTSHLHEYYCQHISSLSLESIRALIFSKSMIVSVVAKIYDSSSGHFNLVLEETMWKLENFTAGGLYTSPWNWKAFEDPSPDRFWLQIEATDIMGRSSISELRPFSINGVSVNLSWTWKEFIVMGCQWANLYYPILWSVTVFLFSILIISKVLPIFSVQHYSYKDFSNKKGFVSGLLWVLTELSIVFPVWLGMLIYLVCLILFPWFYGQVFTEGGDWGYMTYKGWTITTSTERVGYPDIMVIVLPHLCFVVFPAILITGALAAEREVYREHYLSLSGKKEDDYNPNSQSNTISKLFRGRRLVRKFLIVICLMITWKHWKNCSAMMKAYAMNPILHYPVYCFTVPLLLICSAYMTMGV
ncbi:Transmembrane protein [Thalictrum thalictroides]|uniref:Transmembrane protein n=1 Tax=Thalictrum thalictroides TaxID=46969 RepID=A0A7J6X368_THATH|nr:Transmembrane protein [Thalictrum thalictroides]